MFEVTAEPRYARLVRTSLASVAALESFSVDRTGDLRLLADEVFNALICAGARRVVFEADPSGGRVRIVMRAAVTGIVPAHAFDTVERVAEVIAPGFELAVTDGEAVFAATVSAAPG